MELQKDSFFLKFKGKFLSKKKWNFKSNNLLLCNFIEMSDNESIVNIIQQTKPLQDWNEEEVQKWFESYENGKFKEYAKDFQKFNGKDLFELEEKICKETYGNLNGSLLYKQIQKLKNGKSYS